MLFDERDFKVFENDDSRNYFEEIIQCYYNRNYRAAIVLLYSFVVYDLFIKIQKMASEGDSKATVELKHINELIEKDEHYSTVEHEVIAFFETNYPLYFDNFIDDINYLKKCRNKCAHLKVNDNSLYVPKDYQIRMLICSMYDHILSVKAPFIMDLFSIAQQDIENYSELITYIPTSGIDESIRKELKNKYFCRMTYDSLKKSYKTFIKLLFVSDDEECDKNIYGLYTFVFSLTDYIIKNGFESILNESSIINVFNKITVESLEKNHIRINSLISLMTAYPSIMNLIEERDEIFDYISGMVFSKACGLEYYRTFYPRSKKTVFSFFKERKSLQDAINTKRIYDCVKDSDDFSLSEFSELMIESIPFYNGFDIADSFMSFFVNNLSEFEVSEIKKLMKIYYNNPQCTNRNMHKSDMKTINDFLIENDMDENFVPYK